MQLPSSTRSQSPETPQKNPQMVDGEVFSAVFEQLPTACVLHDGQGNILHVNNAFSRGLNSFSTHKAATTALDDLDQPLRDTIIASLVRNDTTISLSSPDGQIKHFSMAHSMVAPQLFATTFTQIEKASTASRTIGALYGIANAISSTRDISELYAEIHIVLHKHVDATNFFIGVLDEENDRIVFPYFSDERDEYYDIHNVSSADVDSLTLRVIRTGRPLFLRNTDLEEQKHKGEITVVGTDPAVWLGVPLMLGGNTIGAMALQHYENPWHYDEEDVAFMMAVSEQVAVAIERKRAEEQLSRLNEMLESMVAERTAELENKAQELEDANERLQELDRIKSALLSSVSHELRTPLTSIMGFAKLIRKDFLQIPPPPLSPLSEKMQKKRTRILSNLEIVSQESRRLTRLITEFLDLAKIESGHMVWYDQHVDPEKAVIEAAGAVQGLFEHTDAVKLRIEMTSKLPQVLIDPDKLRQVFLNLLHNAAKFTKEGEVVLSASASNNHLKFCVKDTGVGIPPAMLGRVFDKFFKVDENAAASIPGTGLGLAICKQIVEHYGGSIHVMSGPDSGSEFHFTLPITPDNTP